MAKKLKLVVGGETVTATVHGLDKLIDAETAAAPMPAPGDIDEWLEAGRMAGGVRMSDERLQEVFELVKPKPNWKMEIDAEVPLGYATRAELETAVAWFAGGLPEIFDTPRGYLVVGAGYYVWVGA